MCCPRIRQDLKGQRVLVITGYFWQFDVSSELLRAGKMEPREGKGQRSGRLCDMHLNLLTSRLCLDVTWLLTCSSVL